MKTKRTYYVMHETASWETMRAARDRGVCARFLLQETSDEGGCIFEFAVEFVNLGRDASPRIDMFNDSWQALKLWPDVFAAFADAAEPSDSAKMSPADFVDLLKRLGFQDATDYADAIERRRLDRLRASARSKLTPEELIAIGI